MEGFLAFLRHPHFNGIHLGLQVVQLAIVGIRFPPVQHEQQQCEENAQKCDSHCQNQPLGGVLGTGMFGCFTNFFTKNWLSSNIC